jgi:hypothetical protein
MSVLRKVVGKTRTDDVRSNDIRHQCMNSNDIVMLEDHMKDGEIHTLEETVPWPKGEKKKNKKYLFC